MHPSRSEQLVQALERRILVLDGAMGTAIQALGLDDGCIEELVLTRPDAIRSIHDSYLEAGCDIVETNSFGATPRVLAEYGLEGQAHAINAAAARLAREACARFAIPEKPRFVAGSIGPTTQAISVTGGVTFEELERDFFAQARGLLEGGADYFLIETAQDTRNVKAAVLACQRAMSEAGSRIPIAVSGTVEPTGAMLAGQSVEALLNSLEHLDLLYIGLNCATGPEFMTDPIRSLARLSRFRVACVPNAGLPDEGGCYLETPEMLSGVLARFVQNGWINVLGGCCGTHAGHVSRLVELAARGKPRALPTSRRSALSGVDYLEITEDARPVIVGERTNVIGSRRFKELIRAGRFDEASDLARAQIKTGARIVDVCLADPDRDELSDMRQFLESAARKVRAPLMIDSTDARVIEAALTYSQGKAIINSINLEDGEARFDAVVPLARKYGAALVVGTIDDDPVQGMALTRDRKRAVAERAYELLTRKHGIAPEDIYWDPLVFPCGTGDARYAGSAVETIEAIGLLKRKFPGTRTVLGISNVSFGLPAAGRETLNSVFLHHCVQAGLDLAIVNAEKLRPFAQIPAHERELSENLLWNRPADPVAAFAAYFRDRQAVAQATRERLPLLERLSRYIIEGSKDGLVADLDQALELGVMKPLELINGPLMKGMDEVGRLFNANQLIVAEVLQSAEAMKAAVAHLEPHLAQNESSSRGRVLLATVKGDVHDIGKNLVEIILANNGFDVVNLGIKQGPAELIAAVREHQPQIVGLSGLLVKSAQQMVVTAEDFAKAGVETPLLVGGAALSANFVDNQIAKAYGTGTVAYASDAMTGLDLAKAIVDPERFEKLKHELAARRAAKATAAAAAPRAAPAPEPTARSPQIDALAFLPRPPDLKRHVLRTTPIERIWKFLNPLMLYGRHLGIKGSMVRALEAGDTSDAKALGIWKAVEEVKEEYRGTEILQTSAIYRFFGAASEGNRLHLYAADGEPAWTFDFPRQRKEGGLCLADYAAPAQARAPGEPPADTVALYIVSVGRGIRQLAESLKSRGDYLKSHIVQALALESAEAYAELLHSQIRKSWGYPDAPEMTMMERFQAKYRGKRYSFGYPACPRLDDQSAIWKLLDPAEIGVQLTDGFMMDPESSVSALVFHHPQATYFSVGTGGDSENRT